MAEVIMNGVKYRQNQINRNVVKYGEEVSVLCRHSKLLTEEELLFLIKELEGENPCN